MTDINHNLKKALLSLISIEHDQNKLSYRKIAKLSNNPVVTGQTVGRVAKSKGQWMPKTKKILSALGVISVKEKRISEMNSKELLWRLENRKEF